MESLVSLVFFTVYKCFFFFFFFFTTRAVQSSTEGVDVRTSVRPHCTLMQVREDCPLLQAASGQGTWLGKWSGGWISAPIFPPSPWPGALVHSTVCTRRCGCPS